MDSNMQLAELRNLAKERGLKNISKLKKDELIEMLKNTEENENIVENNPKESNQELGTSTENSSSGYKVTNEDDDIVEGILEVLPDGYGFLRGENYLSSNKDVYISPIQIKRFRLSTGDKIKGIARFPKEGEKFPALIFVGDVNRRFPRCSNEKKKL